MVFLTFHLPFSKLDFVSLFQSQELPPDKRVVVWVSVGSYERPPPVHLQHNIKQFSLKPISDIMGLTHNIKQFSQKPISDIIGLTHNIKQFSLKHISNIMGVRTGIILNTSYNNLYFGFLENQNLLLYMQQNLSNLLLAQFIILPVLAGNFQNPFTLYYFLKKCNQTACLLWQLFFLIFTLNMTMINSCLVP